MKYALLSFTPPNALDGLPDGERERWLADDAEFNKMLEARDCVVGGELLDDPATATTVRVDDAEPTLTDGPYAETAEVLGGILVIDVADLDEALDVARQCPAARIGPLEVRPIRSWP